MLNLYPGAPFNQNYPSKSVLASNVELGGTQTVLGGAQDVIGGAQNVLDGAQTVFGGAQDVVSLAGLSEMAMSGLSSQDIGGAFSQSVSTSRYANTNAPFERRASTAKVTRSQSGAQEQMYNSIQDEFASAMPGSLPRGPGSHEAGIMNEYAISNEVTKSPTSSHKNSRYDINNSNRAQYDKYGRPISYRHSQSQQEVDASKSSNQYGSQNRRYGTDASQMSSQQEPQQPQKQRHPQQPKYNLNTHSRYGDIWGDSHARTTKLPVVETATQKDTRHITKMSFDDWRKAPVHNTVATEPPHIEGPVNFFKDYDRSAFRPPTVIKERYTNYQIGKKEKTNNEVPINQKLNLNTRNYDPQQQGGIQTFSMTADKNSAPPAAPSLPYEKIYDQTMQQQFQQTQFDQQHQMFPLMQHDHQQFQQDILLGAVLSGMNDLGEKPFLAESYIQATSTTVSPNIQYEIQQKKEELRKLEELTRLNNQLEQLKLMINLQKEAVKPTTPPTTTTTTTTTTVAPFVYHSNRGDSQALSKIEQLRIMLGLGQPTTPTPIVATPPPYDTHYDPQDPWGSNNWKPLHQTPNKHVVLHTSNDGNWVDPSYHSSQNSQYDGMGKVLQWPPNPTSSYPDITTIPPTMASGTKQTIASIKAKMLQSIQEANNANKVGKESPGVSWQLETWRQRRVGDNSGSMGNQQPDANMHDGTNNAQYGASGTKNQHGHINDIGQYVSSGANNQHGNINDIGQYGSSGTNNQHGNINDLGQYVSSGANNQHGNINDKAQYVSSGTNNQHGNINEKAQYGSSGANSGTMNDNYNQPSTNSGQYDSPTQSASPFNINDNSNSNTNTNMQSGNDMSLNTNSQPVGGNEGTKTAVNKADLIAKIKKLLAAKRQNNSPPTLREFNAHNHVRKERILSTTTTTTTTTVLPPSVEQKMKQTMKISPEQLEMIRKRVALLKKLRNIKTKTADATGNLDGAQDTTTTTVPDIVSEIVHEPDVKLSVRNPNETLASWEHLQVDQQEHILLNNSATHGTTSKPKSFKYVHVDADGSVQFKAASTKNKLEKGTHINQYDNNNLDQSKYETKPDVTVKSESTQTHNTMATASPKKLLVPTVIERRIEMTAAPERRIVEAPAVPERRIEVVKLFDPSGIKSKSKSSFHSRRSEMDALSSLIRTKRPGIDQQKIALFLQTLQRNNLSPTA